MGTGAGTRFDGGIKKYFGVPIQSGKGTAAKVGVEIRLHSGVP